MNKKQAKEQNTWFSHQQLTKPSVPLAQRNYNRNKQTGIHRSPFINTEPHSHTKLASTPCYCFQRPVQTNRKVSLDSNSLFRLAAKSEPPLQTSSVPASVQGQETKLLEDSDCNSQAGRDELSSTKTVLKAHPSVM